MFNGIKLHQMVFLEAKLEIYSNLKDLKIFNESELSELFEISSNFIQNDSKLFIKHPRDYMSKTWREFRYIRFKFTRYQHENIEVHQIK